MELKHKKRL